MSKSLPRRLIVTYRLLPGQPNFIAEFSDWDFTAHPADSEFVQFAGDFQFLLWGKHYPDGLFSVTQRGVIETDLGARKGGANFGPRVEFADPDFGI